LLTVLSPGAKHRQLVSYENIAAVTSELGGALQDVIIDNPAEGAYHAKLRILQDRKLVSVDVCLCDAISVALTAKVGIYVAPAVLLKAAEHAARGQWWLPVTASDSRRPSIEWWRSKGLKCEAADCGQPRAAQAFELCADGSPTRRLLLCKSHARWLIAKYARECAQSKSRGVEEVNPEFRISSVISIDDIDVGDVYLRAPDGSCYFLSAPKFQAWPLGWLLDNSLRGRRPLTHESMAAVIRQLGGSICEVAIDEPTQGEFCAALKIVQRERLICFEVRPCEGIALALAANIAIRLTPTAVLNGAHRASKRICEIGS